MKPAKPSQAVDRAQLRRQRSAQGLRLRAALEFLTNIPLEPHAQRKDERASEAVNVPSRMSGVVVSLQGKPFRHVVARGMLETEQFQRALMADGALKSRIFFACQRAYPVAVLSIRGYERSTEQAERHRPSHSGAVAGRLLLNYEVQHLADVQTYAANGTAPRSATRYFERIAARSHTEPARLDAGRVIEEEEEEEEEAEAEDDDVASAGRGAAESKSACSEGDDIDSDKTNDSVSSGEEAAQLGVKDGRALVANARDLIRLYTPMELGDSLESKPADRRFERSLEALGVRASVLGYLRPEVREEQAQAAFEEHHSWISQDLGLRLIALQRLRALLFRVREDCRLQLVTVAHAWCLLEMLVWRSRINAANMSVAMGACILLSVKFMEPPREPGPLAALLPDGQEDPAAAPTGAGGVAARWLGAGAAAAADGSGDDARAQPGPALGGATPDEEGGAGRRDGATLWRRVSSRISGVARAVSNRSGVRRWATRRRENDARASASRQGEDPATTPAGQSDSQPGSRFGRSRLDTPAGGGSTASLPRAAGRGSATDAAQWEEGERARHVDGEDGESWESPARFPAGLGAAGAAAGASAAAAAGASAGPPGFGREAGRGRRISLGDYMPALPPGNTPLRSARALLAAVEARMGASPADVLAVEMDVFALLGFSLHLPLRILLPQVASMRRADRTRAWDVPAQPPAELLPSGQRFAATRSERRSAFLHTARKKWQDAFEASSVPETAFYAPIADAAGDVSSSSDDEDHGRATGHSQHSRSLGRGGEDDEDDGIEGIDGEDEPEEDEGQARLPEDLRAEILAKRADAMGQQQLPQAATAERFLDPEAEGVPAELA